MMVKVDAGAKVFLEGIGEMDGVQAAEVIHGDSDGEWCATGGQ
jgi:hypothetical protein